ncbi:MAG TPA: ArsR family transcriptional regulator [Gemmatimonadales bacterium]|nr:ArsR family transcriptional regulator [Gemmatimonadales bacterium]
MADSKPGIPESTAGRIMALLRRGSRTVDEVAAALGLTGNAIRSHLTALERDGFVRQSGLRRGASKPARIYSLSPEAELLFSRMYVPVLTQLLHVLSARLSAKQFDHIMREVGRSIMAERPRPTGDIRRRAEGAIALLNELGGLARLEKEDGVLLIRSDGCPLSAATQRHPEACNAVESLLSEFTGAAVTACCDREERLRCCFELSERVDRR